MRSTPIAGEPLFCGDFRVRFDSAAVFLLPDWLLGCLFLCREAYFAPMGNRRNFSRLEKSRVSKASAFWISNIEGAPNSDGLRSRGEGA